MMMSKDDFRGAAQETYANLAAAFAVEPSLYFWRLGHSFDTIIDYFVNVDGSQAGTFGRVAIQAYNNGGGDWWDDFGWWAIAALKAAAADIFGSDGVVFRTIALECFDKMYLNAPYGWVRANREQFAEFEPLFTGGVWNHVLEGSCYPGGNSLCGRQNTVTNGLYLVSSSRLSDDPAVPPYQGYRQVSDTEYGFLDQWFTIGSGKSLLNDYAPGQAYVRERVGYFKWAEAKDPDYRPDLAWAGDQGLIVGGLVARMQFAAPAEYQKLLVTARKLLAGTRDYLVDGSGILKPWTPDPAPGGDSADYWTGPAVLMRYLLSAYQNKDLRADIEASDYQMFIRDNAENVLNSPNRPQSGDQVVDLTNNLAILVAAVAMLSW